MNALIIVDLQNDFCPGGSLAVPEADEVVPVINKIIYFFDKVIATQDWHPKDHISFASTHNKKVGDIIEINGIKQTLWPDHCVEGTFGADFYKDFNLNKVNFILRKGTNKNIDSYSAFLENDKKTHTGLYFLLKGLKIKNLYICGLALDYCVYFTACDAINFGFKTYVVIDATRAVDLPKGNKENALVHMKSIGVKIISHEDL